MRKGQHSAAPEKLSRVHVLTYSRGPSVGTPGEGEVSPTSAPPAPPHRVKCIVQKCGGALLRRPASTPTAPPRLRCPVWACSTSRTSDAADDA